MLSKNRTAPAVVLVDRNRLPILDEVELEDSGPGEVLVELRASGICHTDLAAVRDARTCPVVLGHEGAGIVKVVGAGVTHVAPGDHVVINWQPKNRAHLLRLDRRVSVLRLGVIRHSFVL